LIGKRVLTFVGAGGVRSPLFLQAAYRRGFRGEIRLFDLDRSRAELMWQVGSLLLQREGMASGEITVRTAEDRRQAMSGTDAVVIAIRPGGLARRASDERTAFSLGLLGQETVGVCGIAMAWRTLPALVEIVRDAERFGNRPWIFNFTNPVGITTLGLHRSGFARTLGICDSANQALYAACRFLHLVPDDIQPEAFGLNHLSWTRALWYRGRNLLEDLLSDDRFLETYQELFRGPEQRKTGLFFNEYLYYYLWPERAMAEMTACQPLRGFWLAEQEEALLRDLENLLREGESGKALGRFLSYHERRSETYMAYARKGRREGAEGETAGAEGYAGVSLDVLEGSPDRGGRVRVLVVPSGGALQGLPEDAAVEVSCRIEGGMPVPRLSKPVSTECRELIRRVGACERMVVESILQGSRQQLRNALGHHPLVGPENVSACMEAFPWSEERA
jgi:6-phospho-beta-glucosidase